MGEQIKKKIFGKFIGLPSWHQEGKKFIKNIFSPKKKKDSSLSKMR
jgi:hypothetical protein